MRRLLNFLRSYLIGVRVSRHVLTLKQRLDLLERDRSRMEKSLRDRQDSLDVLSARLQEEVDLVKRDSLQTEALIRKYEEQLEATRSQLRIAEEATIPGLMFGNQVLVEQSKRRISEEVRGQVLVTPREAEL